MKKYHLYNISGWKRIYYTGCEFLEYRDLRDICKRIGSILLCPPLYIENNFEFDKEIDILGTIIIEELKVDDVIVYKKIEDKVFEATLSCFENIHYSILSRMYPESLVLPLIHELNNYKFENGSRSGKYLIEVE